GEVGQQQRDDGGYGGAEPGGVGRARRCERRSGANIGQGPAERGRRGRRHAGGRGVQSPSDPSSEAGDDRMARQAGKRAPARVVTTSNSVKRSSTRASQAAAPVITLGR